MSEADGVSGIALDASANNGDGSSLGTRQLREALDGHERFDVMFLDACLMSTIEVAYELRDHADYLIASQSLLFSELPYQSYFATNLINTTVTPQDVANGIVSRYNLPQPGVTRPYTLAAINTSKVILVVQAVQRLAAQMLAALPSATSSPYELNERLRESPAQQAFRMAFLATQHLDANANDKIEASDFSVDLRDLAKRLSLAKSDGSDLISADVTAAAQSVVAAFDQGLVIVRSANSGIYSENGETWDFANTNGLSIYAPLDTQDCRPTGERGKDAVGNRACRSPGAPAQWKGFGYERQLFYYRRADQLQFGRDAGAWAQLLELLEPLARPSIVPLCPCPPTGIRSFYIPLVVQTVP